MNREKSILIAGGDLRQAHLAGLLADEAQIYAAGMGEEAVLDQRVIRVGRPSGVEEPVDCLVLPMPASGDGETLNAPFFFETIPLAEVVERVRPGGVVLAGKAGDRLREICRERGLSVIDYLEREELAVMNAVPTAEGAIGILMEELPTTIFGQKGLVTGFGRLSKVLCRLLTAMGAEITVTARKPGDLAWAKVIGCTPLHIGALSEQIGTYDFIINTVPALLFTEEVLARVRPNSPVIDLASKPGGVDFDTAKNLGVRTVWALSLPGKVAPITSGEIICDTIRNILREREAERNGGEPER